ncbi:MAG: succinate dehydrogenase cytochrome b subunit [Ignavibacteriaceae bacterium]|nr:succinate dehydrogenase cytochrome b subunit [Ignavibacteriaceae bacterium]
MGWFTKFIESSLGKKLVMALTGVLLMLFLTVHFIGNMFLYFGPAAFQKYVETLEAVKPLVRVVEVLLALLFISHIFTGVRLWLLSKKSNPKKYAVNASSENSNIFSRSMAITGSVIFIFLIIHLSTFWAGFNFAKHPNTGFPFYEMVAEWFSNIYYSLFYIIAMGFLGFHLNHAFQSAFQTFGINHKKYTPFIKKIGTVYAIIMALGFASIPIYFLLGGR